MAYTLESVLEQLGDEAQLAGGRIIVYRDGKHTDVGGLSMADAVFSLTEAGKELLEGESAPVVKPVKKESKKAAPAAVVEDVINDVVNDLNLDDLK